MARQNAKMLDGNVLSAKLILQNIYVKHLENPYIVTTQTDIQL